MHHTCDFDLQLQETTWLQILHTKLVKKFAGQLRAEQLKKKDRARLSTSQPSSLEHPSCDHKGRCPHIVMQLECLHLLHLDVVARLQSLGCKPVFVRKRIRTIIKHGHAPW